MNVPWVPTDYELPMPGIDDVEIGGVIKQREEMTKFDRAVYTERWGEDWNRWAALREAVQQRPGDLIRLAFGLVDERFATLTVSSLSADDEALSWMVTVRFTSSDATYSRYADWSAVADVSVHYTLAGDQEVTALLPLAWKHAFKEAAWFAAAHAAMAYYQDVTVGHGFVEAGR